MKKVLTKQNLERGITLISLVIMIIILVIISAIAIRAITGDNDLIGMTTEGAENYKVAEYKEMIIAQVTSTISKNMIQGEETTLGEIADDLREKTDWVKTATAHEDEAITNNDVVVTTLERIHVSSIL